MDILNPLKICSNKKTRINWWGNVIFEKHIFWWAFFNKSEERPKEPPMTKVILLVCKDRFSIFFEKSSEESSLPVKSKQMI